MSNEKEIYSATSKYYCEVSVLANEKNLESYNRSKVRELKYNENWEKEKVNIIEIVGKYAPGARTYESDYKFYFEGEENIVIADMVAGYLRILNKETSKFYRLNGTLTRSKKGTHFKIKKQAEMKNIP